MRTVDPKSKTSGEYTKHGVSGDFWNYGIEIWCNLEGQYVTMVADLAHLTGQVYEMSICSLGVMGAEYVRNSEVPQVIEIENYRKKVLHIENIYAA